MSGKYVSQFQDLLSMGIHISGRGDESLQLLCIQMNCLGNSSQKLCISSEFLLLQAGVSSLVSLI